MTFDDDFARIHFASGTRNIRVKSMGEEWPPPVEIEIAGVKYTRTNFSAITDAEREKMEYVCRGAEYQPTADLIDDLFDRSDWPPERKA